MRVSKALAAAIGFTMSHKRVNRGCGYEKLLSFSPPKQETFDLHLSELLHPAQAFECPQQVEERLPLFVRLARRQGGDASNITLLPRPCARRAS
jgi:hypothetical protein